MLVCRYGGREGMFYPEAKAADDIKLVSDTITVQVFSSFYHYFLSINNTYIEKYHNLMAILRRTLFGIPEAAAERKLSRQGRS